MHDGVPLTVGGAKVTSFEVIHASGAPAHALRIETHDRAIAYSGDTEWTDVLVELARDADLFISEAYFYDREVKFHLAYRTLAKNLDRLQCRRTVITHMNADMLSHLDLVQGVEAAEDGTVISV